MQKIGFCERYKLTTAVLNRTKELTRRLEKALEHAVAEYEKQYGEPFEIISQCWDEYRMYILTNHGTIYINTRYKLNEVVAVAQAYKDVFSENDLAIFDDGLEIKLSKGWSNKLFTKPDLMPHRIQITGVRIERLQDISDEDCLKEGIIQSVDGVNMFTFDGWIKNGYQQYSHTTPREAFAALINRPGVGRKGLWESNPFVVVYEFKLVK